MDLCALVFLLHLATQESVTRFEVILEARERFSSLEKTKTKLSSVAWSSL